MYSPTLLQRSTMTSTLGLPQYVITFLRHMETHKDCLKWNISESSHKITLTLTWNFKSRTGSANKSSSFSEHLLDKLQRSLSIGRSQDSEDGVPRDLSKLLETTPKKHKKTPIKTKLSLTMGAIRRTLSTSSSHNHTGVTRPGSLQRSSSFTMAHSTRNHHQHSNHISSSVKLPRHNSFHMYGSQHMSPATETSFTTNSPTKSAYSWGGGGAYNTGIYSDDLDASGGSPPLLDPATESSCCSESLVSPTKPRVKLTYRYEDEIQESLEDIMEKTRTETKAQLEAIKKEWNETIREWPNILKQESRRPSLGYQNPPPSLSSTFLGACGNSTSGKSTDDEQHSPSTSENLQSLEGAVVGKCLDSCDKILTRYETDIT